MGNNYGATNTVTALPANDHVEQNSVIANEHVTTINVGHKSQDESQQQGMSSSFNAILSLLHNLINKIFSRNRNYLT